MTHLLDGNVLVALTVRDHVHAAEATGWFVGHSAGVATSPITQGTLLRHLLRNGVRVEEALAGLAVILAHPRHELWPDDTSFDAPTLRGVIGHRQVTDAYLAAQARRRGGRLATLDRGLAATHPDVAELIGT